MKLPKLLLPCAALLALGACSVSDKKLTEFGETAQATVQIVGLPSTLTRDLIAKNEVTRNACRYLNGAPYKLAATPSVQMSKLLTDQQNVTAALDAYAKAIAGALDAEAQGKVNTAGTTFATSLSALGPQIGASSKTGPTASLLLTAITRIEEDRRISNVKAEMEKVLPFLNRLRELLARDQASALAELDRQIAAWEHHTRCVLAANRRKSGAEPIFREADQNLRTLTAQRKQAERGVPAMDALIDAHFEFVFGETSDLDDGIDTLNDFLAKVQAIKDA